MLERQAETNLNLHRAQTAMGAAVGVRDSSPQKKHKTLHAVTVVANCPLPPSRRV